MKIERIYLMDFTFEEVEVIGIESIEEFIRRIGKEYRKKEAEKEIERLKKELGDV